MNPTILGVIGPGFLNQVPTLRFRSSGFQAQGVASMDSAALSRCFFLLSLQFRSLFLL